MSIRFSFFTVLLLSALACCNSDTETGDLNLRFHLTYGDQPLEMFKTYEYPTTKEAILFNRLSFFISNIGLKNTTTTVALKDIDYLDLTNSHTAPIASNGLEYKIKDVEVGNYQSLQFSIGVPPDLNAKNPNDFNSSNVLSNVAEYWGGWKSYIFFRPEGKVALDGSGIPNTGFALHLGADDAFVSIVDKKEMEIKDGMTTDVDIYIDMQKFFDAQSLFDINTTQQIHTLNQNDLVKLLAKNLSSSIK